MKNVLYIGPYRQLDEWGMNSRAFAKMLSQQEGVNLVLRPVWFNQDSHMVDIGDLSKYENKQIVGEKNVLIQHGIPSFLNYDGSFEKNIAVLSVDCKLNNQWKMHLNLFDEVLVFSDYEKQLLEDSNIQTNVCGLNRPPMFDSKEMQRFEFNVKGLIFYTNVSLDKKSGIREIAMAYYSECSIRDDCILILCCTPDNASKIEELLNEIKVELGIYSNNGFYPHVGVAPVDDIATMNFMHEKGDYYIDASYNCRISQNSMSAIRHNSKLILLETCKSLFEGEYPLLINSKEEIITYKERPIKNLYTGDSTWKVPDVVHLKSIIRKCCNKESVDMNIKEFETNKLEEILCL